MDFVPLLERIHSPGDFATAITSTNYSPMADIKRIGKYEIVEELGRGGFATVYKARHAALKTEVALKVLDPARAENESIRQRFIREAQTASGLEHPNIVQISDLQETPEGVCIAMEYLPGGDLRKWADSHKPLPLLEALRILGEVAAALDHAHQRKVWHRDVKPTNVLMDAEGHAHLSDFGLVLVADAPHLTRVGTVVGTPNYLSPEQAQGKELDGRTDQYSLAIVAYELLAGQLPFIADTSTAALIMRLDAAPPAPSTRSADVPAEFDEVLLRALERDPAKRYASCAEFVRALNAAFESSKVRRFREYMAEARAQMGQAHYEAVLETLNKARSLAPGHADLQAVLAELEQAQAYDQCVKDWEAARQKAQNALDLIPNYPDPSDLFVALGLRPAVRRLPTPNELARQGAVGLALGVVGATIMFGLAFLWIVR